MSAGKPAPQRATLHVDVGPELSARIRAAAAAGGRTPSEWTRELLQRELAQAVTQVHDGHRPAQPEPEGQPRLNTCPEASCLVPPFVPMLAPAPPLALAQASAPASPAATPGRLVLDAELASLLMQVQMQGQFRTRPAALRLVLRHFVGQGVAAAAAATASQSAAPVDAAPLKDGVAALMRSNHELLPIGKNINQIAKSLNAMQGGFRSVDTKNLQAFAQAVREHVDQAARVVSTIRALVTPHKEKP